MIREQIFSLEKKYNLFIYALNANAHTAFIYIREVLRVVIVTS